MKWNFNFANVFMLSFILALSISTNAEERRDANAGVTVFNETTFLGTTLWEALLESVTRFKIPFLRGDNPLTEGNNITFALTAQASPVSANAFADAIWTPAALLELSAGGGIGSGWNIKFFGDDCHGIGINRPDAGGKLKAKADGGAFDGALWRVRTGGALQFDLAAVFPGDWNHVVARTYHEINYKGYTRAKKGESWYYENDAGENCNGLNYYAHLLVGYQMPMFFNMAALLAEADLYLYDTPELYYDDKMRWTFSLVLGFAATKQLAVTLLTQFATVRNYQEPNWEELYYRNRTIDPSNPISLGFHRFIAAITYNLTLDGIKLKNH